MVEAMVEKKAEQRRSPVLAVFSSSDASYATH